MNNTQINTSVFVKSSPKIGLCPSPDKPEFAFIGRSNVGKSSLINALTDNSKLAKISSKPGKTKLINHFLINDEWYLVDLPGYGWAKVSKAEKSTWEGMIKDYLTQRESLVTVFLLIDIRLDPQPIDLNFIEWLGINRVPFTIVFTKKDKIGKTKAQSSVATYKRTLKKTWEELPPILVTSSQTKEGIPELLKYINSI